MIRQFASLLLGLAASAAIAEAGLHLFPVATGYGFRAVNADNPVLRGEPSRPYTYSYGWSFRRATHGVLNNDGFISDRNYQPTPAGSILLIGDSYVHAAAVPESENLHAQLAARLRPVGVFGLARPGGSLPDYLAMAQWGVDRYHPLKLAFLIVSGDVDESVLPKRGGYYFQASAQGFLQRRIDRGDLGPLQRGLNESVLFRYLYDNLAITVNFAGDGGVVHLPADDHLVQRRRSIAGFFLSQLEHVVPARDVVFLIHRSRRAGSFVYASDVDTFGEVAREQGFRVIDLGETFAQYEARTRHRLDASPVDVHWNALAHAVAADDIAPTLRDMLSSSPSPSSRAAGR